MEAKEKVLQALRGGFFTNYLIFKNNFYICRKIFNNEEGCQSERD